MQQQTLRRLLLAGAFTAAGIAGAVAWDSATSAAHAADKKPAAVVEQPGGVLDHRLPEQASDRAKQVHGQVAPDKPKPAKPKPSDEPKPAKPETPAEPKPQPVDEPSEEPAPAEETPAHGDKPAKVPPVAVEPAPSPDPIVTLPAIDPSPLPDATDPTPAPVPVTKPSPVLPALLPVTTGTVPTISPPAGVVAELVTSLTAAGADQPPVCVDDPDDARHIDRDALRALLGIVEPPAAATPRAKPAPGCPGHTVDPHGDGATTAANGGHNTGSAGNADLADSVTAPALTRLAHARPRSSIPAGRHAAIEPGPA